MQDLHEGWAAALAAEMADQKVSRAELARRCGVQQSTVKRILEAKMVPSDTLKWKICGALSLRMDQLYAYPRVVPPMPQVA